MTFSQIEVGSSVQLIYLYLMVPRLKNDHQIWVPWVYYPSVIKVQLFYNGHLYVPLSCSLPFFLPLSPLPLSAVHQQIRWNLDKNGEESWENDERVKE